MATKDNSFNQFDLSMNGKYRKISVCFSYSSNIDDGFEIGFPTQKVRTPSFIKTKYTSLFIIFCILLRRKVLKDSKREKSIIILHFFRIISLPSNNLILALPRSKHV